MMLIAPLVVILSLAAYSITFVWLLEKTGLTGPIISVSIPVWSAIPASFNILYLYIWLKGAKLEGIPVNIFRQIPHLIYYMNVMMPIAALRALYQEIFKPVAWEKTTHEGRGVMWRTLSS
jgi:hypothetical protein